MPSPLPSMQEGARAFDVPSEPLLLSHNFIRKQHPPLASALVSIRATPYADGLGAFAATRIMAGTEVYIASEPFASCIYAPFKKEVCAFCFEYDRGRKMKYAHRAKVGKEQRGVAWFCSEACQSEWTTRQGSAGIAALSNMTAGLAKVKSSKFSATTPGTGARWPSLETIEHQLQKAQEGSLPMMKATSLLRKEDDQDLLYFILDGLLAKYRSLTSWDSFLSLIPSLQVFDTQGTLESHVRLVQFLRASLPDSLKRMCTAQTYLALVSRDHGNSFGIFEGELGRDGEMLGYGSWTEASFFNHSCEANLSKRRRGRAYVFTAKRDIQADEELCINYIEDAVDQPIDVRWKRLRSGWGFVCGCPRCMQESSDSC